MNSADYFFTLEPNCYIIIHKVTGHNKFVWRVPTLSGEGGLSKTPSIS